MKRSMDRSKLRKASFNWPMKQATLTWNNNYLKLLTIQCVPMIVGRIYFGTSCIYFGYAKGMFHCLPDVNKVTSVVMVVVTPVSNVMG